MSPSEAEAVSGRCAPGGDGEGTSIPVLPPGARAVECCPERHASAILDILNDAILHSTALYDYHPRPLSAMAGWFAAKAAAGHPVIGIEDPEGRLLGFASYGPFRAWPAYKYTVEHAVYVHRDHRRQGLGDWLLSAIVGRAQAAGVHLLVGGIDATNAASIRLHERHGFVHAGTLHEVGFKFGRWLDLAFYQRRLSTPAAPADG